MSKEPLIINGKLHTAYAIFFRTCGARSIEDLINELGLGHYQRGPINEKRWKYISATDDGEWIHLCDSYSYDYWYDPEVLLAARAIARRYDMLMLTFPDTDNFYEIEIWKNGVIQRRLFWEDTSVWGKILNLKARNIGRKLPIESSIRKGKDPCDGLWKIAESLGISTKYENLDLKTFVDQSPLENRGYSIAQARHGRGIITPPG